MKNTEKKYWQNGIHKRGRDFYSIAISFKSKAVLICFSFSTKFLSFNLFNLTK